MLGLCLCMMIELKSTAVIFHCYFTNYVLLTDICWF